MKTPQEIAYKYAEINVTAEAAIEAIRKFKAQLSSAFIELDQFDTIEDAIELITLIKEKTTLRQAKENSPA